MIAALSMEQYGVFNGSIEGMADIHFIYRQLNENANWLYAETYHNRKHMVKETFIAIRQMLRSSFQWQTKACNTIKYI